jgi:hypothetical protein
MAYAIPTKITPYETQKLTAIQSHVEVFMVYADEHPLIPFVVTRIGCGLAGYKDEEIAPLFKGCGQNVYLPIEWKPYLGEYYKYHDRSSDPKKIENK